MKIISEENKIKLIKRLKSLAWRGLTMGLASLVGFASSQLGLFNLPPFVVASIGLVLGEITKFLNNELSK